MYAGKVMEHGLSSEVIGHPAHPYTEGLMSAFRRQKGERMYFIPGQVQQMAEAHQGCPFVSRCEYASDICREQIPEMQVISDHRNVACYHPLN
jgi:oligopeptide/dipeptide ABC transporter ATP-binding protein